jgi:hypothetical protein
VQNNDRGQDEESESENIWENSCMREQDFFDPG